MCENIMKERVCQKWFARFRSKDFLYRAHHTQAGQLKSIATK